jgi:L-cysteine/cystine lyase
VFDVEAVRAQLPVTGITAYLNTGTAGPWPTPVVEAIEQALRREQALGRASPSGLPDFRPVLGDTRSRLAELIGADADEVALTHSATEGIDIVAWGLDWQAGDEVVTTSVEHRGVLVPLRQLGVRRNVAIKIADIGSGSATQSEAAIAALLTTKTRLVAVSHVSFSTGACLPIRQIGDLAHAAGAMLVVDGAQAVGALPVDVHALGMDFYAFPGQKWLCGPEGTGGLYVRRDRQPQLQSTFVGTRSASPGAGRYEWGTLFRPGIHGLQAALAWFEAIGRDVIFSRTAEVASYCYKRLSELPRVEMVTPPDSRGSLVNIRLPGVDLDTCVAALSDQGFTVRSVPDTQSLRISCAFFNTQDEIEGLIRALASATVA